LVGLLIGREVAGFCLGWVWSSVISLLWLGLAAAWYGGLESALERLKDEPWIPIVGGGYFVSALGSWVGGMIGAVVAGFPRGDRRSVFSSSGRGAAFGGLIGAVVGLIAGWVCCDFGHRSTMYQVVVFGLSLPVGLLAGWLGGQPVRRPGVPPVSQEPDGRMS
jgi:hypothetical protein